MIYGALFWPRISGCCVLGRILSNSLDDRHGLTLSPRTPSVRDWITRKLDHGAGTTVSRVCFSLVVTQEQTDGFRPMLLKKSPCELGEKLIQFF